MWQPGGPAQDSGGPNAPMWRKTSPDDATVWHWAYDKLPEPQPAHDAAPDAASWYVVEPDVQDTPHPFTPTSRRGSNKTFMLPRVVKLDETMKSVAAQCPTLKVAEQPARAAHESITQSATRDPKKQRDPRRAGEHK